MKVQYKQQLVAVLVFGLSLPLFAGNHVPYNFAFKSIKSCKAKFSQNTRHIRGSYRTGTNPVDLVIVGLNRSKRVLYSFGNEQGASFENMDEANLALEKLKNDGICPE